MKKIIFILIFAFVFFGLIGIKVTKSFFIDTERVAGNVLSVATDWITAMPTPSVEPPITPTPELTITPTAEPTLTVTPTFSISPTPSISPTGGVVINEVYYDVAPGKGNEGNESNPDEWIELYNNTDSQVNLKDWSISDNSGAVNISHANLYIPAYGFAVLAKSASTWSYWTIPDEAVKIVLGQKIGNGLANDGDRVILKDSGGNIIDQMSYGNDKTVFDPPCLDVAEGHSLERSPAGKDTDIAADFVDRSVPTPGY